MSDLPAGNLLHLQNDAAGKVIADDASIPLVLNPRTTNSGLLEATGAAGLVVANGYKSIIIVIDQSGGGTISALGTDGVGGISAKDGIKAHVDLDLADVIGGTLSSNALGVINVLGSAETTFDGSTATLHNKANVIVQPATLTLKGTIDNTATIDATYAGVLRANDATLQGGGSIILDSSAAEITGADLSSVTTLHNVDNTITGNGWIGTGSLQDFSQYQLFLDNQAGGTVNATGTDPNAPMTMANLSVGNAGLIEDTGAGGLLLKNATLTQTGAGTLAANGNGTHVDLIGSTIIGGMISASGGGVIKATNGVQNTLDGSGSAVINAGSLLAQDNATFVLKGALNNTGLFTLEQGLVDIGAGGFNLTGGGKVVMAFTSGRDSNTNAFFSDAGSPTVLHNVDNTIEGAGWLGLAAGNASQQMSLDNEAGGTIVADNPNASLNFNTGATVTNEGVIRVVSGGTLVVDDALSNSGNIVVEGGGTLDLKGAYSGNAITVQGGGSVNVEKNTSVNITFAGAGTLVLPDAATPDGFFGTITGFGTGDALDLSNLAYASNYQVVVTNSGSGLETLLVAPDGDITRTAAIAGHLAGSYTNGNFTLSQDLTGGTRIAFTSSAKPKAAADFNGDGTSDVLWRNNSSGDTGYWTIANNTISGWTGLGQAPTTFSIVGLGNFNGDGTTDILWRNPTSGDTGYWTIANNTISGWTGLGQAPTTFNVVGVGDFSGDGTSGVLWRNPTTGDTGYWRIANNTIAGWSGLGQAPTTFNVVGVGDFNGDGTSDVLWRNPTTGDTGYWTIANNQISGWVGLGQVTTYNVVGVGDFNGDGISDILWRNPTSGDTGYWAIANNQIAGWTDLGQAPTTYTVENGATSAGAEGNGRGAAAFGFGDVALPAGPAGASGGSLANTPAPAASDHPVAPAAVSLSLASPDNVAPVLSFQH